MNSRNNSGLGDPTWEVAHLFPSQGSWSVADYLALDTNHLVELSEGRLEVLAMPTEQHQLLVAFLYNALRAFVVAGGLGKVLFAPLRVQLWEGKFREPDLVFLLEKNIAKRGNSYWRARTWSWKWSAQTTQIAIGSKSERSTPTPASRSTGSLTRETPASRFSGWKQTPPSMRLARPTAEVTPLRHTCWPA